MAFDGHYLDWNQKRIKGIVDFYGYKFMYFKRVLDLGCGYADISGALHRLGADVTAVDGRQDHLKIVNKKFSGIKTVHADLDRGWPFQGRAFDIILDLGLLCHLSNYEAHLRAVCASTTHLVLETAVCDSDDPYKNTQITENKGIYDLSVNGLGCRPSAAAIERVLTECGMNFKRLDDAKFNAAGYVYNWTSRNDNNVNIHNRRIWFAVKKSSPIQFANIADVTPPAVPPPAATVQTQNTPQILPPNKNNPNIISNPTPYVPSVKVASSPNSGQKIRLFYNYYEEKNPQRKQEIDACLQNNINNPLFDIVILDSLNRPTYNFFFEKINKLAGPNDINIICNADIFFDNTATLIQNIKNKQVYALNHWNVGAGGQMTFIDNVSSQDAWITRGKIEGVNGDFPIGLPGSSGRIAFEFQQAGYNVINPSRSIKIYHAHNSNIKNYTEGDRVTGSYLDVAPTTI